MSIIEEVRARRQKLADVLDSDEYSGIREIVEELYPDQAHFIFELLQNAQDTRATEATFELRTDALVFEHNGRPFNKADVEGITNIGKGTKRADEDTIGRFGVGFKAVFAYSETPEIYSPTFTFLIENLVLPREIEAASDLSEKTRFVFPFNNSKKEPDRAFQEISEGLTGLGEAALLFLSSLESIGWRILGGPSGEILRIQHSEHHVEILRQTNIAAASSSHFLRFEAPVDGLGTQSVAVAYPLKFLADQLAFDEKKALKKQMRVAPAEIGQVAVFFPAEKENSGLRFHLHAPFVPELSRASVKETPANIPLFEQLAKLAAQSLYVIKDLGLLNAEFLGVLPNNQDSIPKRYEHIRRAIITELNEGPLTPTQDRSHAPAKNLRQSKASLKEVISDDDLEVLVDYLGQPPKWAASAPQKNSNADRMFSSLNIKDWDLDDLVSVFFQTRFSWMPKKAEFDRWLKAKPDDWLQQLYSLLYREHAQEGDFSALEQCAIIKLRDGSFSVGPSSFFPSDVGDDEGFPRVDPATYSSGKSKAHQNAAKRFLEEVGVRHVGEAELVEAILESRYSKGAMAPRPADLKRFVALVESEPSSASMFRNYHIFETQDGKWAKPSAVYLDEPFIETGLRSYYQHQPDRKPPYALASRYEDDKVSRGRFAKFAIAVGSATQLDVKQGTCSDNPNWTYLWNVPGERHTDSSIDKDYFFAGFTEATKEPSLDVSSLIWKTVDGSNFPVRYLQAVFQRNRQRGSRSSPSRLTLQLKDTAWIPQKDGSFVRPADARPELLPPGFPYDPGKAWLKAVGFGEEFSKRTEEGRKRQAIAEELGFQDAESLADAQWFATLDPEARRHLKEEMERRASFALPEHEPSNPERRASKIADQAEAAPLKQSEERTRSVSVGLPDVKAEAEQYLRRQYTNADGEMICQVCKAPLPFKLDDGRYYVEKVEFIGDLSRRHYLNYLALCPNHAAMYQHAHGTADIIRDLLIDCEDGPLEVILAGRDETIYFTQTHLLDLKAIVEAEAQPSDGSAAGMSASNCGRP